MSEAAQPQSRMAIIREQAARGQLGKTAIPHTGRKVISIDKLIEDPENERKTFDDMDDLVASVKAHGIIEPCTVTDLGNGSYQIATGHRRFRAAKLAGLTQLEVLLREPEEKWQRRKKSLVSNIQRSDIRPLELAESLKQLLENDPDMTNQEDLAKAIGKDKSWVSHMLRILDLPTALKKKVGTSQLFLSADAVSKVARLDDPKLQEELIDELLLGGTVRSIRERINTHKGKAPTEKTETTTVPKPKWVFHTAHADIIIQAKGADLSKTERIAALEDALNQAKALRA